MKSECVKGGKRKRERYERLSHETFTQHARGQDDGYEVAFVLLRMFHV